MFKLIGHRFFAAHNPENSLSGIKYSVDSKAWAVETDVQLTQDGVPVLIHDKLLNRTTNQNGYISNWTFNDLNASVKLTNGEHIPSLEELFQATADTKIKLYLEIIDPKALRAVQDLIQSYELLDRVVISSFLHNVLIEAKHFNPVQRTMALFECDPIDPAALLVSTKAEEVGIGFDSISQHLVDTMLSAGADVYAWTVNDTLEIARAKNLGLSGIFTDV